MKALRFVPILMLALSGVLVTTSAASAASTGHWYGRTYNCTGGNVPPGSYNSMIITGVCYMPAGNVVIRRNLTVAPGALLDNGSPGDPSTGTPVVSAVLFVGGNVTVWNGAVLLLGCTPNGACGGPPGISTAHIRGNLRAFDALGVVVQSAVIGGNFLVLGGGGGTMGGVSTGACFGAAPPAPWSEDTGSAVAGSPVYSDVEDSSIGGNFTIAGLSSCWLGSLRNQIGGNATFIGNSMGDPDAMEIGANLINGNLTCLGNAPAPQFGEGAAPDLVGRRGIGQCGFNVVLPNPSPEALQGAMPPIPGYGINEHFAVSTRSLRTYFGTHTVTAATSGPLEQIPTDSGDTIFAQLNNFTLTGHGLVGTGTYNGGPPAQSGEAYLSTIYPDGSQSFSAYDTCDATCSFDGQTGAVTLRAYGTTSRSGFTKGTFLITSAGTVLPTPTSPAPGLSTLVGYGTFWGFGSTVHIVEHLGFG